MATHFASNPNPSAQQLLRAPHQIGANIMANSLSQYATAGEARIARKLIRAALAEGWTISVNDGEETTVSRSSREREILDAMCSTGEDIITIHLPARGKSGGSFYLVYGNDESGEELIADHTDNENCQRLSDAVYGKAA
jgi:hypothetical protein